MVKLMNIRYIVSAIVAMDILIEGDAERKYRLVLDLSSEKERRKTKKIWKLSFT